MDDLAIILNIFGRDEGCVDYHTLTVLCLLHFCDTWMWPWGMVLLFFQELFVIITKVLECVHSCCCRDYFDIVAKVFIWNQNGYCIPVFFAVGLLSAKITGLFKSANWRKLRKARLLITVRTEAYNALWVTCTLYMH